MRTRILVVAVLFFLTTFFSANGQTKSLILTREQNGKWLDSLKTLSLDQQLLKINQRLLDDTNVFVRQFYNDRIKVNEHIGNRLFGEGKPTLIISGSPMIIDNKTDASRIIDLTKLLTKNLIKDISILSANDPATIAIYGSLGSSGIIVMTVTRKKHLKKFKKLKLQSNGYRYT